MSDTVGVDLDRALRMSEMAPCRTLSTQRWVGKTAGTDLLVRDQNLEGDEPQADGEVETYRDEGRATTQAL